MGARTRRAVAGVAAAALIAAVPAIARPVMTKSQAAQLARAVNLTADDVRDHKPSPSSHARGEDLWGNKRVAKCAGRRALGRALADVETDTFERQTTAGYDALGSEVEVMPSAKLAKKDIAIFNGARGRKCLLKELRATTPADMTLVTAKLTPLAPGLKGGLAMHVTLVLDAQGTRFVFYTDIFAMARRNVEAALFFLTSPTPPARADEDNYIGIVDTRLDAALNPNTIL